MEDIQPGLMVVHGNRLEDLRDLLVEWLARAPLAPLEDELMLVQSNGIAQWLKLALARPRDAGGMGISAAVDMQLPGRFLWRAYRAVLGREAVPADSPFDKSRLAWRLMRLLPAQLGDEAFAPLRQFLGEGHVDPARLFQLAQQVADLFDQYQVYRADWLDDWEHGRDVLRDDPRGQRLPLPATQRWQAQLWRALLHDVGAAQRGSHRAAMHRAFLARIATLEARPVALPRRIVVFGISSLPQQTLEALTALGRVCQVFLLVTNPCRHYWADIIEDRELLKAERHRQVAKPGSPEMPQYEELHLHANPLLAAWGKQGRDYIRLLDGFDAPEIYRARFAALNRDIDLFTEPGRDNLLHQVQQAILDLEPLPADPAQRQPWRDDDESLRFHVVHNPQREVEVLHDELLALFERTARQGRPLAPRDVMVMVPDIQTYAPHIQAVFGRIPPDDPRYLPCSIADRPARGSAPLLVALEQLLRLPESRFAAGDILDLLDVPALRRRLHLDEADLPVLRRWIEGAGIRWGLDGAQKESLGLPPEEQNSWRFGLRRMLLGYAVGDGPSLHGIAPYAEVGGLDAALVGPLAMLLERLEHWWRLFVMPATPAHWIERLRNLLADMFDAGRDDDDALVLQRLDDALSAWEQSCAEAGFDGTLPLAVVREHWLAAIDESRLSQRFLGGAVSFGTLLPMRAIPFRVVCLLGMNDGDYPRRTNAPDFDLMATPGQQRPGDRSRREDDRYLFLEALLSARDTLYVSWVGKSARDNSELPPSVLVGQLRDYLAAGWQKRGQSRLSSEAIESETDPSSKGDPAPLFALTTDYPLQAFSPSYFDAASDARLFTYAAEWQRARQPRRETEAIPLAPWPRETPLNLALLQGFLRSPAKLFYAERLGVHFAGDEDADTDNEPFALGPLENHQLTDALLRTAIHAGDAALAPAAQRLHEQGELPPGSFGALTLAPMEAAARRAATRWHALDAHYPRIGESHALHGAAHGLSIEDTLDDLRTDDDGGHVCLVATASQLMPDKKLRHDKLLAYWATHLLVNANALSTTTHIVAPDAMVQLRPLDTADAKRHLDALLAAFAAGLRAPLPLARKTAFAWLQVEAANAKAPPDKQKSAAALADAAVAVASKRYDHSDGEHGRGEVDEEPALARSWPDFAALHAAGFEDWLHLYRPLLDAACVVDGAA
ncbi:exodeoxyribonuclease V subunit gamma [Rhodanobacter sp. 7MK24]|uniref:exodeoxyribonuclease V subunit gamma n=1 Tax=Rhodanobacter sp. 7MK24 TaxID=2775922 RepID=UPI0017873E4D|nr:exodeoxyribonuclease V subunit gamma [Rhodanobacter sp. 7MK24]MBD8880279.1 exodeoxyribonuclease V subunit gamma [Rhodanobacter sp. 7MK24]